MVVEQISKEFKRRVCDEVEVRKMGVNEYAVYTPFMFDDGDHFVIHLILKDGKWRLTDHGHTCMHMSYENVDFQQGTRRKIIDEAIDFHGLSESEGSLFLDIVNEEDLGYGLYSFVQGLNKISNVTKITREVAKSTFYDDLKSLLVGIVPQEKIFFDWYDKERDPSKLYVADMMIQSGETKWFVFGIHSNEKCSDATIFCLTHEAEYKNMKSIALFEDQSVVGRKQLAKLSNVIGKQFSSLEDSERIRKYFQHEVLTA